MSSDDRLEQLGRHVFAVEELLGDLIVEVGQLLHQIVAVLLGLFQQIRGDVFLAHVLAVVAVEVIGAHPDQPGPATRTTSGSSTVTAPEEH